MVPAVMEDATNNIAAESFVNTFHGKTEKLSSWIRSVRTKQKRVRRQKKSELRRMAILSLALRRAEDELLCKQRARAQRWAEMQHTLGLDKENEEMKNKMAVDDWWQNELKDLDNFFNNLSNIKVVDSNR